MKKLLFTIALILFSSCVKASASMVLLDYIGDTLVTTNNIERPLIVNSDDGKVYNISIRPLEETITNSNGSYSIPLQYLFINNAKEDVYLKYNEYSNIFAETTMEGVPRVMTAKIKEFGVIPAGIYSINLEVQAIDIATHEIASTTTFNLQFIVPTLHELNTYADEPKINISAKDAFKKHYSIQNEVSPMIYIRSNTDWILSIDTTGFDNSIGNYYVRTVSSSNRVTSRLTEKALILPEREIILARGKAPAQNEYVAVEFSIENKDGKFIPAGNYTNKIKYVLREGEVE